MAEYEDGCQPHTIRRLINEAIVKRDQEGKGTTAATDTSAAGIKLPGQKLELKGTIDQTPKPTLSLDLRNSSTTAPTRLLFVGLQRQASPAFALETGSAKEDCFEPGTRTPRQLAKDATCKLTPSLDTSRAGTFNDVLLIVSDRGEPMQKVQVKGTVSAAP